MKSEMKLNSEHLFELATLEIKASNVENAISFWIPKYSSMQIQQLQYWYSKCNSKEICPATRNRWANQNFTFNNAIEVSLFLLQLSFACKPALHFNNGKKLLWHISFSSTCFSYYRKHRNNDVLRFVRYCLLLAYKSTFMTDSQYLGTIHTWKSLNEHHYYLT